jgi:hypothetical protein
MALSPGIMPAGCKAENLLNSGYKMLVVQRGLVLDTQNASSEFLPLKSLVKTQSDLTKIISLNEHFKV